jgi:hypothetical protein
MVTNRRLRGNSRRKKNPLTRSEKTVLNALKKDETNFVRDITTGQKKIKRKHARNKIIKSLKMKGKIDVTWENKGIPRRIKRTD